MEPSRTRSYPHLRFLLWAASIVAAVSLAACASPGPPPRIGSYLGDVPRRPSAVPASRIEAGLLVIGEVPPGRTGRVPLPQAMQYLTGETVRQIQQTLPVRIVQVLPSEDLRPTGDRSALIEKARQEGLSHLVVAVFSHAASVVPQQTPLIAAPEQGGSGNRVPGLRINDYALAELALLDVETGDVLLHANGRAWAEMIDLYPRGFGNYPVIHRSLRIAPIYPRRGEDPHAVLQYVSGQEALEQALSHLEKQWRSVSGVG